MSVSRAVFSPLKIKSVTFKNRIGVSPMCQYSATDGFVTDYHLVHLGSRAMGGAGLVIAEATGVDPVGRITPGCAGIWKDEHIAPWKRITDYVKSYNSVIGIQIAHAGRKASCSRPWEGDASIPTGQGGWDTVGASALAFGGAVSKVPRELTVPEIQAVEDSFAAGAARALKAGFQLLELHFAHGYLVHSFYSPLSNKRTDAYGGSFENRVRLALEITKKVRKVWPAELPLAVRLSCSDWIDGGWTIEDTVKLSALLREEGVDIIDCSSGFNSPEYQRIPFGPSFQVPFAERIKKEANIATAAVGLLTKASQLEEVIQNGQADLVLVARKFLDDPHFVYHVAQDLQLSSKDIHEQGILTKQYAAWISRI
eukprot:TRINITY_DN633_c0_g1_i1.p1 TRINITY_DN633_c0_g1~~TRINITY_DN633_c0_g1_i1.p1  ORF type:complete len:369 (-),score=53.77 TRINITY_DN633_c0_g1_i1:70-1176(-)